MLRLVWIAVLILLPTAVAFVPTPPTQQRRRVADWDVFVVQATRRDVLQGGSQAALLATATAHKASAVTAASTTPTTSTSTRSASTNKNLLVDLPMIRLRLPRGGFGREYLAVPLKIGDEGPFTFMVDTGLTTELITPHLQQVLHIPTTRGNVVQGLAAGGTAAAHPLVELKDVTFPGNAVDTPVTLPILHAVVTDFPQEHVDPAHDPVEGMIGMEALSLFDVDLDFPAGRLRLYAPGTVAAVAQAAGLVEIPAVVINETGLWGMRVTTTATNAQKQPILGFLDCGATFSVVNTAATSYLGLPADPRDPMYKSGPVIAAVGLDGRPLMLPTASTALTFAGDVVTDAKTGQPTGFAVPPAAWKPWNKVSLAVGDIPAFSTILGDGTKPYQGPAALIGLDVLAQRRVILETAAPGNQTRKRRVWVSPK